MNLEQSMRLASLSAQASEGLKWGNRPRMFSKSKRQVKAAMPTPRLPGSTSTPTPMTHVSVPPVANTGGRTMIRGKGKRMTSLLVKYKKACAAGWEPPEEALHAAAPTGPGWEGVVKKLKKHPEVDNPWALAHWMKDKGYKPRKK